LIKFDAEVLYKALSSRHGFHETLLKDIKGINEFIPVLSIFSDLFG
jgi:hypothetical protein